MNLNTRQRSIRQRSILQRPILQQGFTLTEILVALVLGLFLTGVVIAIFASSQSTFRATTEVSRSQENTRFALSFLSRNIRMAGYTNCSDNVSKRTFLDFTNDAYIPSMEHAVFGWEFDGTNAGETYALNYESLGDDYTQADVTAARTNNTAGAGSWDSRFIRSVAGTTLVDVNLPTEIADYDPLIGSDIIAVSISTPLDIFVENQFAVTNTTLPVIDYDGNPTISDVEQGQLLKLADCSSVDLFQNVASDTDTFIQVQDGSAGSPGNVFKDGWQKPWGDFSNIYSVDTSIFFIGTGASGRPSLYQWSSGCGVAAGCDSDAVELVEGVENMQVMYGEDTTNDGVVDSYISADEVSSYANVKSVKIGLLVRSPDVGKSGAVDDTLTYTLLDTTTINPPDDNYLRYVSNATIYLRNTGL